MKLALFGDPHGDFSNIHHALADGGINCAVFLGDFGLSRPLQEEIAPLLDAGLKTFFIHGNHEGESDDFYDFVFGSSVSDQNISSKVVNVDGVRIAGLGGVFRRKIWSPTENPDRRKFETRQDYIAEMPFGLWRDGLPRRHRVSIFPEDFSTLGFQRADILVSHEAPSSHPFGFRAIDLLAAKMGSKLVVHGHHHESYRSKLVSGQSVIGLGKSEFLLIDTDEFGI